MSESHVESSTELIPIRPNEEPAGATDGAGAEPEMPAFVRDAAAAYEAELDDLLAHLAAHPAERWVAYRGGRRIGFGTDRREFLRACLDRFPDRQFRIYGIDGADKCPENTVI